LGGTAEVTDFCPRENQPVLSVEKGLFSFPRGGQIRKEQLQ
jgi:hypothetical protein